MEIQELPGKTFKIIVLKMLRKLLENIDKQFNDIRKIIQKQNEKFKKKSIKELNGNFEAEEYED